MHYFNQWKITRRKKEDQKVLIIGEKIIYQATAIQLAGERSTLLSDIKPGYLSANPVI